MSKASGSKFLKYLLLLILLVAILCIAFFLAVYKGFFGELPTKYDLKAIQNEEASLVYSSDNEIIGKFFAENRTNIQWKDVPKHLKNALIATEDRRFFYHKGYDTYSYFRVLFKSVLLNGNDGGGSTLTQQLVKNLYGRKSYGILTIPVNKIKEAIIATRIEEIYTKEELLLLYLNSVPFGEDVYGIESAAQRFFSKHTRDLRIEESAVLVGMLKANTFYNPVLNPENSLQRRNVVLNLMAREKYISAEVADSLKKLKLKLNYEKLNSNPAGYFVEQVKKNTIHILDSINNANGTTYNLEKDGLRIYTTLNMEIQEMALSAINNQLSRMQKLLDKELQARKIKTQWLARQKKNSYNFDQYNQKHKINLFYWEGVKTERISKIDSLWHYYKMLHGAVLISQPKSGAILCWIGGNHFQTLPFDLVLSHRQSASTFKPFLYASAIENGFEPCTYLENTEKSFEEYENWTPENYDKGSTPDSTVAFWYALIHSMNLPSVDLFFKLGADKLENTCEKLKLPRFKSSAPAMALGALDVSLFEMVRAYGAFANNGNLKELNIIEKITDAEGKTIFSKKELAATNVIDTSTCKTLTAILQQVVNQGTAANIRSQYGFNSDLAGKTGTAQNYTDAWFMAYTPNLVVGTWVGANTPEIHFFSKNGSGSALAMPIVATILKKMELNSELKNKYLTNFGYSDSTYSFLQCEPYHSTAGIKGFFEKLFDKKHEENKDSTESRVKSFFRRIFGGKK